MTERKTSSRVVWALAVLISVAAGAKDASAGLIVLSGDGNIAFDLPVQAGNQQFFRNVLGSGTSVLVLQNDLISSYDSRVDAFYDGQAGVSSTLFSGTVTGAALAGVDLFVSVLPDAFSLAEIDALDAFLIGGGTAFFMGENSEITFTARNDAINAALAGLGSGMQILPNSSFDGGAHTATGGQIHADPLTSGVTSLTYASPSQISGGTTLLTGTGGQPFVAYESSQQPIPEPGTLLLLGAGLASLSLRRRA